MNILLVWYSVLILLLTIVLVITVFVEQRINLLGSIFIVYKPFGFRVNSLE